MRTLTTNQRRFLHRAKASGIAGILVAGFMTGLAGAAHADCPWIVQPHFDDQRPIADQTLVNIVFDGVADQPQFFYGFTVTDLGLAWDLSTDGTLTDLGPYGRSLDVMETTFGQAFEVHDESIEPHTVYLVAARSPVGELEELGAAIQPSQPFNVSFAKTRGASDVSGPLPRRSLPGVEIRASKSDDEIRQWLTLVDQKLKTEEDDSDHQQVLATMLGDDSPGSTQMTAKTHDIRHDVQICAYQVAMR